MAIRYVCRYCNSCSVLNLDKYTDVELGFDQLTPRERKAIITNSEDGDTQVRIVCETCQQTLVNNPELCILPYFYH